MKIRNDVEELQALVNRRKEKPRSEAEVYVGKLNANSKDNHMAIFWIDPTNDEMLGQKQWNKLNR